MVRAAKATLEDGRKRVDEENKAEQPPDKDIKLEDIPKSEDVKVKEKETVFQPEDKPIVKGEETPPKDKEIPPEKIELELEKEIPPEKVELELEKEIPPEKVELELEKEIPLEKDLEEVETPEVHAPVPTPPALDFEAGEPVIVITEEPTENLPLQVTQLPTEDLPISTAPSVVIIPFDPAEIASVLQGDGAEQNETHFPVYKSEHISNGDWWNEASEHIQPTHPLQYGLITVCITLVLMSVGMVGFMRRRMKNRMKNDELGTAGVL